MQGKSMWAVDSIQWYTSKKRSMNAGGNTTENAKQPHKEIAIHKDPFALAQCVNRLKKMTRLIQNKEDHIPKEHQIQTQYIKDIKGGN